MQFSFDLISDLHIESWTEFNWEGQATSPYCVVAGDVAKDPEIIHQTLEHLSQCYQSVFYIDGNEEHRYYLDNLGYSYQLLNHNLQSIDNLVYMQDNVVIINGIAILATNGWWGFDFDTDLDTDQSRMWYCDKNDVPTFVADSITSLALNDTAYMVNSVRKLQTYQDVKSIIIVTHTVPAPWLVNHDIDLVDTWRFNQLGNKHMRLVLEEDTEHKIKTWCFGHYHKSVDRFQDGIRYVNNCRGRGDTDWSQSPYYPKRIAIDY